MSRRRNHALAHYSDQFGRRLRALREARGWSTRELENRSGVSDSLITHLETAQDSNPGILVLLALQRAFNLPSIEILLGEAGLIPTDVRSGELALLGAADELPSAKLASGLRRIDEQPFRLPEG